MAVSQLLSFENPVFSYFAFYSVLNIFKMFYLVFRTAQLRGKNQAFCTPEDVKMFGKKKDIQVNRNDPDVERARGNHLNDLENIPVFMLLGFLYVLTQPTPVVALWHFRVFLLARICHTISYQYAIRQPARATCHMASLSICLSMGLQVLLYAPQW